MMSTDLLLCVYVCVKKKSSTVQPLVSYLIVGIHSGLHVSVWVFCNSVCVRDRGQETLFNKVGARKQTGLHPQELMSFRQSRVSARTNTLHYVDACDLQLTESPRPARAGCLSKALYFHVSLPSHRGQTTLSAIHNLELGHE